MSKPVKNMITDAYRHRFEGLDQAVLVNVRGIEANQNNAMRSDLAEKQIRVTLVKNSLARRAFSGTDLEPLGELLEGPNAMVYSTAEDGSVVEVARELMGWAKTVQNLEFKGALLEGTTYSGESEVQKLSEFPTKEEAQAQALTLLLSPGRNLAGSITSPGSKVASVIKAVQEKLENGETIQ